MLLTTQQYLQTVRARATTDYPAVHKRLENRAVQGELKGILKVLIQEGQKLDQLKKHLMYGKEKQLHGLTDTKELKTTNLQKYIDMVHSIVGTITEGIEQGEILLKILDNPDLIHDKDLNTNFIEEMGDSSWYEGLGILAMNSSFEEVMTVNDKKLEERSGPVFSAEGFLNRNVDAEKAVMENAIEDSAKPPVTVVDAENTEGFACQHVLEIQVQNSSQIHSQKWENKTLTVNFKGKDGNISSTYIYKNVTSQDVWDLMLAPSMGKLFASKIKANPEKYPFEKKT